MAKPPKRCCRSTPRCRACPKRFRDELREVLSGVEARRVLELPPCLAPYAPLLGPPSLGGGARTEERRVRPNPASDPSGGEGKVK